LAKPNGARDAVIFVQLLQACNKRIPWGGLLCNFP